MRRLRFAVSSCLAVVLLAACDTGWVQPLGGPDHASFNAGENVLTLANVTTLQQAFHTSVAGTPLVKDGVLVVGSGNTVTGFDARSGAQKWQQTLPAQISGGPFIDGGNGTTVRVSYTGTDASFEPVFDLSSGSEPYLVPTVGAMLARRGDNSLRMYSLPDPGGQGFLTYAQISGKRLDGQLEVDANSPTLGPKYLYVAYRIGSVEGIAAYDPNQDCADFCTAAWTHDMLEQVFGPPALGSDGTLYVGPLGEASGNTLTAMDGNTGSVKWSNSSLLFFGTPAVANGVVYSQTNDPATFQSGFVALSAADGHLLWTATTPVNSPTVAGGVVYGTNGSEVVAYNANGCGQATCAPIWTASLGTDTPSGGLAVTGGMLYVGTNTGVTAFKPTTS